MKGETTAAPWGPATTRDDELPLLRYAPLKYKKELFLWGQGWW